MPHAPGAQEGLRNDGFTSGPGIDTRNQRLGKGIFRGLVPRHKKSIYNVVRETGQ